ncbi:hypothetical protein F907_02565 [Acinetobacter colistiniresistens]|uniref:Uncharacterized protein n=1 Tax=Acinetobacter colistiniresistens TaxID=280145 RepID=S3TB15_9GAMM|nr:hypothetical protein F907_02565 [Acinetobacter colistiniresistens]TVT83407.1 hypothetical protein FPV60_07540 [Acinetobacter colistiniresistens]
MPLVGQGLHGCTLCPIKDFCYFSSLKSKRMPTQNTSDPLQIYEAMQTLELKLFKLCFALNSVKSASYPDRLQNPPTPHSIQLPDDTAQ